MENLSAIIEAILFVSGDPVRVDALAHAMNLTVSELEAALSALGELTGKTMREEIVARIFERFCVGK